MIRRNWYQTKPRIISDRNEEGPVRDGFKKKKKKLMEFSNKGPDPASQPLNGKKNKIKHGLKML